MQPQEPGAPSAPAAVVPKHTLAELVARRLPRFAHHYAPRNVNVMYDERLTVGQRVADQVAATMGSWPFIIFQSIVLLIWMALNIVGWFQHWDPYPFILLNLALSFQAAYSAPIIMMSQNRQSEKDRLMAQHDYEVDCKAEDEVKALLNRLEYQHELTLQILARLEAQEAIHHPTPPTPPPAAPPS